MGIKHQVGVRIRVIRKQRGLTQEGLAARIDRSVETISNLECGRSLPSFETLVRLAESLDVPIRDFFEFGEDVAQSDAYRLELLTTLTEIGTSKHRGKPRAQERPGPAIPHGPSASGPQACWSIRLIMQLMIEAMFFLSRNSSNYRRVMHAPRSMT